VRGIHDLETRQQFLSVSGVVEVVGDVIQHFCWEVGIRHRGFRGKT
jgi:hypothetical protein